MAAHHVPPFVFAGEELKGIIFFVRARNRIIQQDTGR